MRGPQRGLPPLGLRDTLGHYGNCRVDLGAARSKLIELRPGASEQGESMFSRCWSRVLVSSLYETLKNFGSES